MTGDAASGAAQRPAGGRTGIRAGIGTGESAAGQPAVNPANPVAARRNAPRRDDPQDWLDDREAWSSSTRLVFVCAWCQQVAEPRMGVAAVDQAQAQARARALNVARKRRQQLDQVPPRAQWVIVHDTCHQPAIHGAFEQRLTRLRTVGDVLNTTLAMIEGQSWLMHTNWRTTVHRILKSQSALRDLGDTP